MSADAETVTQDVSRWLERAVIGLNLCPFAKAPQVKGLVHIAVSEATDRNELLEDLAGELDALMALQASQRETTLLVAPRCLQEFLDFNDFMAKAERAVRKRGLEGIVQLASFHPGYQFEGSDPDDISNFTNRAPYPVIHLLREDSITRAVGAIPDPAAIYEANMKTLERLGHDGWAALGVGASA